MREFLNEILAFIDSESLTDEEFESLDEDLTEVYTKEVYEALKAILQAREGVSGQLKKLKAYFIAKGVDLVGQAARTPASEIVVGVVLSECD